MSEWLEDDADLNDDRDYKTVWLEQERLRQENSVIGWIYIGLDTRYNNMAKVGLTTGELGTRASGSQNPFYALLCAFKIKEGVESAKIKEIENSVIGFLSESYERIPHATSLKLSEWFYVATYQLRELVHDFLYHKFNWYMYSYWCSERNEGIIYSWENEYFLRGSPRNKYRARNLKGFALDPACYMPGGCGANCDCWG